MFVGATLKKENRVYRLKQSLLPFPKFSQSFWVPNFARHLKSSRAEPVRTIWTSIKPNKQALCSLCGVYYPFQVVPEHALKAAFKLIAKNWEKKCISAKRRREKSIWYEQIDENRTVFAFSPEFQVHLPDANISEFFTWKSLFFFEKVQKCEVTIL